MGEFRETLTWGNLHKGGVASPCFLLAWKQQITRIAAPLSNISLLNCFFNFPHFSTAPAHFAIRSCDRIWEFQNSDPLLVFWSGVFQYLRRNHTDRDVCRWQWHPRPSSIAETLRNRPVAEAEGPCGGGASEWYDLRRRIQRYEASCRGKKNLRSSGSWTHHASRS